MTGSHPRSGYPENTTAVPDVPESFTRYHTYENQKKGSITHHLVAKSANAGHFQSRVQISHSSLAKTSPAIRRSGKKTKVSVNDVAQATSVPANHAPKWYI